MKKNIGTGAFEKHVDNNNDDAGVYDTSSPDILRGKLKWGIFMLSKCFKSTGANRTTLQMHKINDWSILL